MAYSIVRHVASSCPDLAGLEASAVTEGHELVTRTARDWRSGENRFDQVGECFFVAVGAVHHDGGAVGIVGLNRDPYLDDPTIGRLRHLYVHPAHRRAGMATELVGRCLAVGARHFRRIRLRTSNPSAAALYRILGFEPIGGPDATHELRW